MSRQPTDAEFCEFVAAVWAPLYRTAFLMVGEHALAEDVVQTALTNTYVAWHRVREREAARAYARSAVVNSAITLFRVRARRREQVTSEVPESTYSPDPSTRPVLLEALRQLPPRQRAVVVLRYYEDLSVAQVADTLGCSPGTVKSQTSDALAKLRVLLGDAVVPPIEGVPS